MDQKQQQKRTMTPRQERSAVCLATWLATFHQIYHQPIEELAAAAYREALKGYSAAQIDRGCKEAIKRCAFIPKPAEIIRCIEQTAYGDYAPEVRALPEAPLSNEESRAILLKIREQVSRLKDQPKRKSA